MINCLRDGGGGGGEGEGGSRRRRRGGRREEGGNSTADYCRPFLLCEGWHCCRGVVVGQSPVKAYLSRGGKLVNRSGMAWIVSGVQTTAEYPVLIQ